MTSIALPQRLTLTEASAVARDLSSRSSGTATDAMPLVMDASALQSFDSSAFAVMLDVVRQTKASGRAVSVRGAPASMVELARLYGVDELLSFSA